jgi:hypothetical protein
MSNPIAFSSATPNIGLPLLIAGQAQKEFFVNQALAILDAMHPRTVLDSQPAPPSTALDGDCYRVTAPATLAWEGCENHLAVRIGGDWHLTPPREGMRLYDRAANHSLFFRSGWQAAATPAIPSNGTVIDVEARAAIDQIIAALRDIGIFTPSGT